MPTISLGVMPSRACTLPLENVTLPAALVSHIQSRVDSTRLRNRASLLRTRLPNWREVSSARSRARAIREVMRDSISVAARPMPRTHHTARSAGTPGADGEVLAPGQLWKPGDKIQFPAPDLARTRRAMVWTLDERKQPQPRQVELGITDGINTEIVSGELQIGRAHV